MFGISPDLKVCITSSCGLTQAFKFSLHSED